MSGPLLDRIDLHVEVPALNIDEITEAPRNVEPSEAIRTRVMNARGRQRERLSTIGLYENGQMSVKQIRSFCVLGPEARALLKQAIRALGLSARAYDRVLRVARTIADLSGTGEIEPSHVAEAISYRVLDRIKNQIVS
jgi:magnesium chelatase family protein